MSKLPATSISQIILPHASNQSLTFFYFYSVLSNSALLLLRDINGTNYRTSSSSSESERDDREIVVLFYLTLRISLQNPSHLYK